MTYCISQRNTHLLRMRRILLPFFWNVSLLRTLHNSIHFTHQTGHSSLFVSSCMETEVDLQCLIYKHLIIQSGRVEESGNLVELTRAPLFGDNTLCPGIMEDFSDFGYVPKALRVMDGAITTTHAKSCMIWHVPSSRQNISSRSNSPDPRWRRVCSECLKFTWYVKKRVKAKNSVDAATKSLHQMPSSHCPWKFLSPSSKRKPSRYVHQQRTRLPKQTVRFYKKTKVELPVNQSNELCQLIQAIESSEEGKAELGNLFFNFVEQLSISDRNRQLQDYNLPGKKLFFLLLFIFRFCFQFPAGMAIR